MKKSLLRRALSTQSQLYKISDPDVLIDRILYEARKSTNADAGSIYIMQGDLLIPYSAQNTTLSDHVNNRLHIENLHVPIGSETISGYVAASKTSLNIQDVYNIDPSLPYSFDSTFDKMLGYRSTSMLTVPLRASGEELLGVLQLINKYNTRARLRPFNDEDVMLIDYFAGIATLAIERAQFTRSLITRMIRMTELHDPHETAQHTNRVAGYSTELYTAWAIKYKLPKEVIDRSRDTIRLAAMLHDVGKIAISDLILKKKTAINEKERQIMETHTWKGALLFKNATNEIERMAMEVALTHHEHWDGSGYPGYVDPTTGEPSSKRTPRVHTEIPLSGRIVTIADVYDALRSKRIYKIPWSEEDSLNKIVSLKSTQFDPELVELFCSCIPSIRNIGKYYEE